MGAVSHYGVTLGVTQFGMSGFPHATLTVNVVSSFLIGVALTCLVDQSDINQAMRLMIQIEFLGTFTTFSALGLDVLLLIRQGRLA